MLEDEPQFNNERNWNREAYYSQAQTEVHGVPPGASLEGEGRVQTETGPGVLDFLGVHEWIA